MVRQRSLRALLSFEATERVSGENRQPGLHENADFVDACRPALGERPVGSGLMCSHTTFTCSATAIRRASDLARERGALSHMRVSEGVHEPEYALEHFGAMPPALLRPPERGRARHARLPMRPGGRGQ